MSAYDSRYSLAGRLRVRIYVEPPVTHVDDDHAVMLQLTHETEDRWGPSICMSPNDARRVANGLLKAANDFENMRDKR